MSNTVRMQAPVGFTGTVSVNVSTPPSSGQTYTPDANGGIVADPLDVGYLIKLGWTIAFQPTEMKIAATDSGTTKTLGVAAIIGGNEVFLPTAGGTTPSLTLPLAADLAAALAGMAIGQSYKLRVINTNSGTATMVTNTGWTTSGTLTLATNTWRDFVITKTGAATFSIASAGTGTTS